MAQTLLISLNDFAQYRAISANLNSAKKLDPYILEAQQFDLKGLLGNAFYHAIVEDYEGSPSLATYSELFNGSEWQCGDKTYRHEGLKPILCYFAYARYVFSSNTEATAFGTRLKKEEYSDAVDDKTIIRLRDNAVSGALAYWEDVKLFLNDNSVDYPLWICDNKNKKIRISEVDNTASLHYGNHGKIKNKKYRP